MPQTQSLRAGAEPYPGYRLRQLLSRGSFGEVWEAEVARKLPVALKFLPCANSLEITHQFRAIQAIQQFHHPYLVRIEQVWSHMGYIVCAMELAEGSLRDLLEVHQAEYDTPIDAPEVCRYLVQVAEALDYLNSRQHARDGRPQAFQHCAVQPSHMLLFGDTVKLSGLALVTPTTARIQIANLPADSLAYAAPELFQGQLSDRSDQYALAVSYCELRGGRFPFPPVQEFRQSWPMVRPVAELSMVSPKEQPILTRALSRVPANRWPSCVEFVEELTKAVN